MEYIVNNSLFSNRHNLFIYFKMTSEKVLESREALIEMYKAGFLDGFKIHNKVKKKKDWEILNKFYKLAFFKRFEKKITKVLKKKCKGVKNNG